jgi:heme/copper-type cytochrome/quinol oxidase subunit 1
MHLTGLWGMPRRVYTYPDGMGWDWLNLITSIGAFVFAFGVLLLLVNVAKSLRHDRLAGANPWDAPTLEWAVPSPPPYNFAVIPHLGSRYPLWEDRVQEGGKGGRAWRRARCWPTAARPSPRHRSRASQT